MASAGVTDPSHFARLSASVHQELTIWAEFLDQFNGRSLLLDGPMSREDLEVYF